MTLLRTISIGPRLTDGTRQTVAADAAWPSANTGVVTVSSKGVVVGVNAGSAGIAVACQGATGTLDGTVAP